MSDERVENGFGSVTAHVDDLKVIGKRSWLDFCYDRMTKRFGTLSRQVLPLQHVGVMHRELSNGIKLEQETFATSIKYLSSPG